MEKEEEKVSAKDKADYEKFIRAAGSNLDEVTMVLRSHLLAEYYFDHILLANIPRGDMLIENKFTFWQKITIVESLNIVAKEVIDSIKGLNAVRNSCAHSLEYKISESDVDKIGRPFGKKYLDDKMNRNKSVKELLHWTLARPIARLASYTD